MIASSSGLISTGGIADSMTPMRRSLRSAPLTGDNVGLTAITATSRSPAHCASLSRRSWSANSTFAPQSRRPYSISSGCHSAFIATAMAPIEVTAEKARIHSG